MVNEFSFFQALKKMKRFYHSRIEYEVYFNVSDQTVVNDDDLVRLKVESSTIMINFSIRLDLTVLRLYFDNFNLIDTILTTFDHFRSVKTNNVKVLTCFDQI